MELAVKKVQEIINRNEGFQKVVSVSMSYGKEDKIVRFRVEMDSDWVVNSRLEFQELRTDLEEWTNFYYKYILSNVLKDWENNFKMHMEHLKENKFI